MDSNFTPISYDSAGANFPHFGDTGRTNEACDMR